MRILLINQYAGSPRLGMEYRPHWMAIEWQKEGHDVLIVAGNHSHLRTEELPTGPVDIEGVPFYVLKTLPYQQNGFRRFANILSFRCNLMKSQKKIQGWNPDIVIASSTHPMDVRPAIKLARSCNASFIYEIHDLWPLTPKLLGGMPGWHPMIAWMQREENFGYRSAETVVSLLPGTEEYAIQHGLACGKWVHIPNGATRSALKATSTTNAHIESIENFRQDYQSILIYAGSMGLSNDLGSLLSEWQEIAALGIGIVLVGDGVQREILMTQFRGAVNVLWLPQVSREQVHFILSAADFAYVGARSSPLYEHGVSMNKIFDYMLAHLPIIENIRASNSLTRDAKCGIVANPAQPHSLLAALKYFIESDQSTKLEMGINGHRYVLENATQAALGQRMLQTFENAMANQK